VTRVLEDPNLRFANFDPHPVDSRWVAAIQEDHKEPGPSKVRHRLVLIDMEEESTRSCMSSTISIRMYGLRQMANKFAGSRGNIRICPLRVRFYVSLASTCTVGGSPVRN
jgi:hypothetical protein